MLLVDNTYKGLPSDHLWAKEIIIYICMGILISPWGVGLLSLILFAILRDVCMSIYYGFKNTILSHSGILILSSVLGWIIGRTILKYPCI